MLYKFKSYLNITNICGETYVLLMFFFFFLRVRANDIKIPSPLPFKFGKKTQSAGVFVSSSQVRHYLPEINVYLGLKWYH